MSKYEIIDAIPDGVDKKDIEEKYCEILHSFLRTEAIKDRETYHIEVIRKKINDMFVNAPDDYDYEDIGEVTLSNLFKRGSFIFKYDYLNKDKKHNIKYLYDIERKKYYRINYFPRDEDLTEEDKKVLEYYDWVVRRMVD